MGQIRLFTRMVLFSGLSAACLLVVAAWMGSELARGAMHREQDAREAVADVLPPPLYLVELRLLLQMAADGDIGPDEAAAERTRLERAYRVRLAHWQEHGNHVPRQWLAGQQVAAEKLLAAAGPVLQAAREGDAEATAAALRSAHALYLEHRRSVDATVRQAHGFVEEVQAEFDRVNRLALAAPLGLFVLTVALLLFHGWSTRRGLKLRAASAP